MPMAAVRLAAALVAAYAALALRLPDKQDRPDDERCTEDPIHATDVGGLKVGGDVVVEKMQRQLLNNYLDVQYFGYITIGGQTISGLIDTGSFDLVVFDKGCDSCGKAGVYSSNQSRYFRDAKLEQTMYFGSGSVTVREGFDKVIIGPYEPVNLSFWDATSADMPVLKNAAFNSIIGVGPPETSSSDAWKLVQDDVDVVMRHLSEEAKFPTNFTHERLRTDATLATELGLQPTLIKADDVGMFSICLGKHPGSPGYFIWNDTSALDHPDIFTSLEVLGKHTWTMRMTDMKLGPREDGFLVGCDHGCGAIVDSGTSLLLMPYEAITRLGDHLRSMRMDCSNPSTLPHLVFKLDGKEFSLPPDAYLAKMVGNMASSENLLESFNAVRVPLDVGGKDCQLAVMGSSSFTSWGPLWILGMPFFRKYYTSFQVGKRHSERRLLVTEASSECTPASPMGELVHERGRSLHKLRHINRSAILVPRIVHKAMTQVFLDDL